MSPMDVLDIDAPNERAKFIERACHGNQDLLASVRALLREHEREDNPIDKPVASPVRVRLGNMDETELRGSQEGQAYHVPGATIGPYKLMEQIGEGGFGLVYVADQQGPVRRRVALKIIKPGMESREVLARFEAERQAIALMDHPSIARVYNEHYNTRHATNTAS